MPIPFQLQRGLYFSVIPSFVIISILVFSTFALPHPREGEWKDVGYLCSTSGLPFQHHCNLGSFMWVIFWLHRNTCCSQMCPCLWSHWVQILLHFCPFSLMDSISLSSNRTYCVELFFISLSTPNSACFWNSHQLSTLHTSFKQFIYISAFPTQINGLLGNKDHDLLIFVSMILSLEHG